MVERGEELHDGATADRVALVDPVEEDLDELVKVLEGLEGWQRRILSSVVIDD